MALVGQSLPQHSLPQPVWSSASLGNRDYLKEINDDRTALAQIASNHHTRAH